MNALKQIIAIVVLSAAIVFAMTYAQQMIQLLLSAHDWVAMQLLEVFSAGTTAGNILRGMIALLAIPVFLASIPGIIYWMVRRHWFPYFTEIVWIVWLVQAGALIMKTTI